MNGTAALSPGTHRNLVCGYDINSAQKRHFLRRQLGSQHEGTDANGYFVKTNVFPDGGTRIESYFKDGSLARLTGTAVHPVRYTNNVELESGTNRFFTQEIKLDANANDTSEWTKTYYDTLNRPYKTVYANSTTNYPFIQSFYNAQGQLAKHVDPDGVTTLFVPVQSQRRACLHRRGHKPRRGD